MNTLTKQAAQRALAAVPPPTPKGSAPREPRPAPAPAPAFVGIPRGAYQSANRETALVVKSNAAGVWFLVLRSSGIVLLHHGQDRFRADHPVHLPDYPILRAAKKFNESTFPRSEQVQRILNILLRA